MTEFRDIKSPRHGGYRKQTLFGRLSDASLAVGYVRRLCTSSLVMDIHRFYMTDNCGVNEQHTNCRLRDK